MIGRRFSCKAGLKYLYLKQPELFVSRLLERKIRYFSITL